MKLVVSSSLWHTLAAWRGRFSGIVQFISFFIGAAYAARCWTRPFLICNLAAEFARKSSHGDMNGFSPYVELIAA
jgi:hypothetical protein